MAERSPDQLAADLVASATSRYRGRDERTAMRCALGDAATLCDRLSEAIAGENKGYHGRGPTTKVGQQLSAVAKRCGDAIWAMRALVGTSDAEEIPDLLERARIFATAAHAATGQKRKYTGEAYIRHAAAVVRLVNSVEHTPEMLAAAWLHDVVEDTEITIELIHREFGAEVCKLVQWLTDTSKPEDGNRAAREAIDRARLAEAPAAAQTIKLADIIDNVSSIRERDPGFAPIYRREKAQLLEVLTAGNAKLLRKARALVLDG